MSLDKVNTGFAFRPKADDWNAFVDAAVDHQNRKCSLNGGKSKNTGNQTVLVKNTTATNMSQYQVVAADSAAIDPSANEACFKSGLPIFNVATPTIDDDKLLILATPIEAGKCGRAFFAGITQTKITVMDESHDFCGYDSGTYLQTKESGPFRIIWKEAGLGTKWAIVEFNSVGNSSTPSTYEQKFVKIVETVGYETERSSYLCRWSDDNTQGWDIGIIYSIDNLVIDSTNDRLYRCIAGHTSTENDRPSDAGGVSFWELLESEVNILDFNTASVTTDMRLYAPWLIDGKTYPVVKNGEYWFFLQSFIYMGQPGYRSISWHETDNRIMACVSDTRENAG